VKDKGEFQQKMAEFVKNIKQDMPLLMDKSEDKAESAEGSDDSSSEAVVEKDAETKSD